LLDCKEETKVSGDRLEAQNWMYNHAHGAMNSGITTTCHIFLHSLLSLFRHYTRRDVSALISSLQASAVNLQQRLM